jgi:hypothetical protein
VRELIFVEEEGDVDGCINFDCDVVGSFDVFQFEDVGVLGIS